MLNNKTTIMDLLIWLWPFGIILIALLGLVFFIRDYIRVLLALEVLILGSIVLLIALVRAPQVQQLLLYDPSALLSAVPVLLAIAASEAVVGLAILVLLYRRRGSISAESTKTSRLG